MSALFALPSSSIPLMLMRRSLLFLFLQRAELSMLTVSICPRDHSRSHPEALVFAKLMNDCGE